MNINLLARWGKKNQDSVMKEAEVDGNNENIHRGLYMSKQQKAQKRYCIYNTVEESTTWTIPFNYKDRGWIETWSLKRKMPKDKKNVII